MEYRVDHADRPVYRYCNDFGPLRNMKNIPQIVDFGTATRLDSEDVRGIYPIQSDHYRAPEVILDCGWKMSADIWDLGVLLWDLIQGKELFQHIYNVHGDYDARTHLAEMVALLGPPPPELLARSNAMLSQKWHNPIRIEDGSICESSEQYFGGPFFDQDGKFLYDNLIPNRNLADALPALEGKEKKDFLSFVKMMLAWLPEERKTAQELLEHPFIRIK